MTADEQCLYDRFEQLIAGTDQADVDDGGAVIGHPSEPLCDRISRTTGRAAAVNIGQVKFGSRKCALHAPTVSDKQRCDRSAMRRRRALPLARHVLDDDIGILQRGMRKLGPRINHSDRNPVCPAGI